MKQMKVAVVGVGRIGKMHTENIVYGMPDVTVKAIVDPIPQSQWVEKLKIPIYTDDLNEVLNDGEIDAVIIATSSTAHVELIQQCAAAGKHIFCEKPIAFLPEKVESAVKSAERAGVKLQVGFNRRFDPNYQEVQKAVAAGKIGTPHIIRITNRDPKRPSHEFLKHCGGFFLDFSIHDIDMARYVTNDDIIEVYAAGGVLIDPETAKFDDIDTAVITLKMARGAFCLIDNSRETNYGYDQRLEVFGPGGNICAENVRGTSIQITTDAGNLQAPPIWDFMVRYKASFMNQMREFINCVRNDTLPIVDGYDAVKAVTVAVAAKESLKTNQPIKI